MSTSFTLDDLRKIMRDAVGVDESVDLDGDIGDTPLSELGYDSLAVLEMAAKVGQWCGMSIPDEDAAALTTPQAMVGYVSRRRDDESGEGTRVENAVVIDAPLDQVWDMTNDVTDWPRLFCDCAKVEILDRDGDRIRVRLHTTPNEHHEARRFESVRVHDRPNLTVHGERLTPGPPFEYLLIRWDFAEVADGVRMRWAQRFRLRPNAREDAATVADRMGRYSLDQMNRIKEIVERAASESGPVDDPAE